MNLLELPPDLTQLSDAQLEAAASEVLHFSSEFRKEWQILSYQPTSEKALKVHLSTSHLLGIGGGNRSSKTDTSLAEAVIQATGIIPDCLKDIYPREKIRGPISVRIVCESHTTTLAPVILHKLNYSNWSGVDVQGGERGHWGWIPKSCLIDEDWDRSWKESKRTLTVLCRDPDDPDRVLGKSTFQCMSHDQEPSKFASGEFHLVVIDEPPSYAIYRENRARIMSVGGRMLLGMTWPDDPSIPVDWIYDEIYDIGQPGPKKHPDVEWIELVTTQNPNIDQESVAREAAAMSEVERACRIGGKPIRFSNRIHPLFTDCEAWWCFHCNEEVLKNPNQTCSKCHGTDLALYNHVTDMQTAYAWPTVFLLDPHPRKPHMMQWVQVDGNDDYWVVKTAELADEPDAVKTLCDRIERDENLNVALRQMDPNMGKSPASAKREITWQDEFSNAGLWCDLASDSDVGRGRLNEYLKPDPKMRRPRIHWRAGHTHHAVYQMKRYVWDDYRYQDNKDQKQKPKMKYDDFPTLAKYLLNAMPLCSVLKNGGHVIRPQGQRRYGY